MKGRFLLSLSTIADRVGAQDIFEPADFNVVEALSAKGIDVSALPELANLTEKRALFNPCIIAVRKVPPVPRFIISDSHSAILCSTSLGLRSWPANRQNTMLSPMVVGRARQHLSLRRVSSSLQRRVL
jgi:hypothetical protein